MSDLPLYCSIGRWCELSGIGRSRTYELLASGRLAAKKLGTRTLIDVRHGMEFIGSLPPAEIHRKQRPGPSARVIQSSTGASLRLQAPSRAL